MPKRHEPSDLWETYCLMVLEARSPRSRCLQGLSSSEDSRKGSVPDLSPSFWKFLNLWLRTSNLHTAFSLHAYVCIRLSPFYKDTSHTGFGPTRWPQFCFITSVKTRYPNKVTFWGPGGQDLNLSPVEGHNSVHNRMLWAIVSSSGQRMRAGCGLRIVPFSLSYISI